MASVSYPPRLTFCIALDLHPDIDEVFRSLDQDSVQRRIRRAERAALVEKCGRSEDLLREFYALFSITQGPSSFASNTIRLVSESRSLPGHST